jgi:hypothetical protein
MKFKGCTLSKLMIIYMLLTAEYIVLTGTSCFLNLKKYFKVFFSPLNGLIFNVNTTIGNVKFCPLNREFSCVVFAFSI